MQTAYIGGGVFFNFRNEDERVIRVWTDDQAREPKEKEYRCHIYGPEGMTRFTLIGEEVLGLTESLLKFCEKEALK